MNKKVVFINPPFFDEYKDYHSYLENAFDKSCAYCFTNEKDSPCANFEIDHFKPKSIFPNLENEVNNLRLSCRKCNSHKSNYFPNIECDHNCSNCTNQLCYDNIERIYDIVHDNLEDIMCLDDETYNFVAKNNSNVAAYTINRLRLNRPYLKRLRSIKGRINSIMNFIDSALKKLEEKKQILHKIRTKNNLSEENNVLLELISVQIERDELMFNKFKKEFSDLS